MAFTNDEKWILNYVQSADYVAPHLVTKTMVGTPYDAHGGWWWSCACGKSGSHEDAHVQTACPCGVMWKKPGFRTEEQVNPATGITQKITFCDNPCRITKVTTPSSVISLKPGETVVQDPTTGEWVKQGTPYIKRGWWFQTPSTLCWKTSCCRVDSLGADVESHVCMCGQRWVRPVSMQKKAYYEYYQNVDTFPWDKPAIDRFREYMESALKGNAINPEVAKNANIWGLNGPVGPHPGPPPTHINNPVPDKTRISAFDLFSDELWMEALKRGEHRNPVENHLVFMTLNTMWKDPNYQDTRKKWEATVERMRARR
jgi:hypothetical protein